MTMQPDTSMDPRKEVILNDSPYLKVFLDKSANFDPEKWQDNLTQRLKPLDIEFKNKLGDDYMTNIVYPMSIMPLQLEVYNTEMPKELIPLMNQRIIALGYELGDAENMNLFLEDIMKQLETTGALNTHFLESDENRMKLVATFESLLRVGIYYSKMGEDNPSGFRDFVNDLDI